MNDDDIKNSIKSNRTNKINKSNNTKGSNSKRKRNTDLLAKKDKTKITGQKKGVNYMKIKKEMIEQAT